MLQFFGFLFLLLFVLVLLGLLYILPSLSSHALPPELKFPYNVTATNKVVLALITSVILFKVLYILQNQIKIPNKNNIQNIKLQ